MALTANNTTLDSRRTLPTYHLLIPLDPRALHRHLRWVKYHGQILQAKTVPQQS